MAINNLKSQIDSLLQLQKIDSQIYVFRKEKEDKPVEIEALNAAFEAKRKHLEELKARLLEVQKQRREKELEFAAKEESIKKLKGQLFQLKTNKEYDTMLKEIEGVKADGSVIEDGILGLFEEADNIQKEIDEENKLVAEEELKYNQEKKNIEIRIKEIEDCLLRLESKRKQLLPGVEANILSRYEKVLASRHDFAIVEVENNSCRGCHMHMPPQVINLIKMYEQVVTCENCNRILYINE